MRWQFVIKLYFNLQNKIRELHRSKFAIILFYIHIPCSALSGKQTALNQHRIKL